MRKKLYNILQKVYGILMTISFFGGILPLIPFIIAIIIGGEWGEKISNFLYKDFYPWVIILGSIAILIGLVAMYLGKLEGLSVKKVTADSKKESSSEENTNQKQ